MDKIKNRFHRPASISASRKLLLFNFKWVLFMNWAINLCAAQIRTEGCRAGKSNENAELAADRQSNSPKSSSRQANHWHRLMQSIHLRKIIKKEALNDASATFVERTCFAGFPESHSIPQSLFDPNVSCRIFRASSSPLASRFVGRFNRHH